MYLGCLLVASLVSRGRIVVSFDILSAVVNAQSGLLFLIIEMIGSFWLNSSWSYLVPYHDIFRNTLIQEIVFR